MHGWCSAIGSGRGAARPQSNSVLRWLEKVSGGRVPRKYMADAARLQDEAYVWQSLFLMVTCLGSQQSCCAHFPPKQPDLLDILARFASPLCNSAKRWELCTIL